MRLNRRDFPGRTYSTRIIQFGEGNFLRAFPDGQIDLLNEHTALDAGIMVVRPRNMPVTRSLNLQYGLYTTLIRGVNATGEVVSETRLIRSVNQEIHPVTQFVAFFVDKLVAIANGQPTKNELNDFRELAIFKSSVTL